MAEQASSTSLVPAKGPVEGEYVLQIREFDAAGKANSFMVPVPASLTSEGASVMLRAAVLKRTTWKDAEFPAILHAVLYADKMGLDIMAGDVYSAEGGRLSTTADAKIRHAMASGRIEGYEVVMEKGAPIEIPYTRASKPYVYKGVELTANVTIYVKGWKKPVLYSTTLSEWFTGRNPNWTSRPAFMLRKNALSKAMAEVAPIGVEADEAPPLDTPPQTRYSGVVAPEQTKEKQNEQESK